MLFNSIEFVYFLPIAFFGYWALNRWLRVQNLYIIIVSYVFYGWWDWRFLCLMAFTSGWSYLVGLLELRREKGSRTLLTLSVMINLGILGYFKYCNFFIDTFRLLVEDVLGARASQGFSTVDVILPVGISFYTFQALSYTIDVYRRNIKPTKDPIAFFAFISFFPQLVAGPIERATNLLPQFLNPRRFDYPLAVDGCRQMLWGLFKKVVMAETCGDVVNQIFENPVGFSTGSLWLGAGLFACQIYGDFSGYSDMAIGMSRLFGIKLMRNFAFPYFSRDIAEFWRRWHISLTTWFRDYLYIPLGGSRCSRLKQIRNTFAIFLVSGFWHGASWNFVLWGCVHALFFLPLLLLGRNRKYLDVVAAKSIFPSIRELLGICFTCACVCCAWVFFRAATVHSAFAYLSGMFVGSSGRTVLFSHLLPLQWVAIVWGVEWLARRGQHGLSYLPRLKVTRWVIYVVLFSLVIAYFRRNAAFIYFQF